MKPVTFDYETFARDHWQKKPAVFRRAFDVPLAAEHELFDAFVAAGELKRKQPGGLPKIWLYTEEGSITVDVQRYLPTAADVDFDGWCVRVTDLLRGRRFAFAMNDFNVVSPVLWERLRGFSRALHRALGAPLRDRIDIAVFIGNARRTPFGVHDDTSEGLAFVVRGNKNMRVWHKSHENAAGVPITALRNSLDYDAHVEGSTLLEGAPGDVLFWPQSHWHCAESAGEALACTVNIGVETQRGGFGVAAVADAALSRLLRARRAGRDPSALRPRADRHTATADLERAVADEVNDIADAVRGLVADGSLRDAVVQRFLELETSAGIEDAPPADEPGELGVDDVIVGRGEDVAYAAATAVNEAADDGTDADADAGGDAGGGAGGLLVAVNGASLALPDHPGVRALLAWVKSGERARVADVIARVATASADADALDDDDVRGLLATLVARRAVFPG